MSPIKSDSDREGCLYKPVEDDTYFLGKGDGPSILKMSESTVSNRNPVKIGGLIYNDVITPDKRIAPKGIIKVFQNVFPSLDENATIRSIREGLNNVVEWWYNDVVELGETDTFRETFVYKNRKD